MEIFKIFPLHFHLLDLEGGSVGINLICQVVKSPIFSGDPRRLKKMITFVRNKVRKAFIIGLRIK